MKSKCIVLSVEIHIGTIMCRIVGGFVNHQYAKVSLLDN